MSYVKSLRRERAREGFKASKAAMFDNEDEDLMADAMVTLRISNRNRSSLDRKIRAANSRNVEALTEAELIN